LAFEDAYVLSRWLHARLTIPVAALASYETSQTAGNQGAAALTTELRFKKQHSNWDRLRREIAFIRHHA